MKAASDGEEESDDDDFDEVPEKEGYEPHIPEHLRAEYGMEYVEVRLHAQTHRRTLNPLTRAKIVGLSHKRRPAAALTLQDSHTHTLYKQTHALRNTSKIHT